jgi:hypothetical protein
VTIFIRFITKQPNSGSVISLFSLLEPKFRDKNNFVLCLLQYTIFQLSIMRYKCPVMVYVVSEVYYRYLFIYLISNSIDPGG